MSDTKIWYQEFSKSFTVQLKKIILKMSNGARILFHTCLITVALACESYGQVINTFAGGVFSGGPGDNGPATLARLETPSGICLDAYQNVYISDQNDCRIRKVDTAGIIITVAGNGHMGYFGDGGPADSAQLFYPEGVAVDNLGNIFIADQFNNVIRKVSEGTIYTIGGNATVGDSGDGGPATDAQLWHPNDVGVDKWGSVYFVDQDNSRMKQIDTLGNIHSLVGTGVAGYNGDGIPGDSAQLNFPSGIAVDTAGNVYIADLYNFRVRKYDMATGMISTVAGCDSSGFFGDGGPATLARIADPTAVFVDHYGNIFITDFYNLRIRKVDTAGIITTIAGSSSPGFGGDGGPATDAQLNYPQGVTADDSGIVYIADYENGRARIVKKGPPVSVLPVAQGILHIIVQPNPSFGIITLNIPKNVARENIALFNIQGIRVPFVFDPANRTIDPGDPPDGIYFLRISNETATYTTKIVRLNQH